MTRRDALSIMAVVPLAAALGTTPASIEGAMRAAEEAIEQAQQQSPYLKEYGPGQKPPPGAYTPKYFTPHEWRTARVLSDLIIPRDAKSGSATEAGVPEFMDFIMLDRPTMQAQMRGGLRWLDNHSNTRHGKRFIELTKVQQTSVLDEIAFPQRAKPEVSHGVAFFNYFRDLTAAGFFSSRIGVQDIGYRGNTYAQWNGCPPAAMQRLGVNEDMMKTRIPIVRG